MRRSFRTWAYVAVVSGLLAAGLVVTFTILKPTPPRRVVMSTGPDGSAYEEFARRYRERFEEMGIELVLRESAGAEENLARLSDPEDEVEIALGTMGLVSPEDSPEIRTMGAMFFEPVWVFYTGSELEETLPAELTGLRIGVGAPGGLSHFVSLRLLDLLEVSRASNELLPLDAPAAADRLRRGELDLAFFGASAGTPLIRELLAADGVSLAHFPQADAYVALYPGLTKLTVPAGVGSLPRRRPPRDVTILSFTGALFVKESLHPAIQSLLMEAATEVHGEPDIFHTQGRFPRAESFQIPLSDSADQFYRSGRPFLQRYLPFWMAVLVKQILAVLLPLVGILYPMLRLLPMVFGWAFRRRITHLYGELRLIEMEAATMEDDQERARLSNRLESLDERVRRLRVPESFAPLVYTLRLHIGVIRGRFTGAG